MKTFLNLLAFAFIVLLILMRDPYNAAQGEMVNVMVERGNASPGCYVLPKQENVIFRPAAVAGAFNILWHSADTVYVGKDPVNFQVDFYALHAEELFSEEDMILCWELHPDPFRTDSP
jgi:hypothetical protein